MKRHVNQPDLAEHNQVQKHYFERTVKPRMVPTGSPYLRRHVTEMMRFAEVSSGEKVLEVGCGMGRYTLLLADRGVDVAGLDLSDVLLERLQAYENGRYHIPLYCADVLEPPADLHHAFDAVIGFFTLHHLHDIPRCMIAMTRLLKRGGRIVFLEPNAFNPLYYIQITFTPGMSWQGESGLTKMRPGYIAAAMRAAGLKDVAVNRFGFFPPFISNRRGGTRLERILERFPLWRPLLPFQIFKGTAR